VELDFMVWAKVMYGDAFCKYMTSNYEPVDFLFRLAEKTGVVLMDGGGFGGPPWSIRISLANLDDADYAKIGKYMVESATEYVEAWKASELVRSGPTAGKGQTLKAGAAKRVAKKAAKKVAKTAVKKAVKQADTAAKSAKKATTRK
jgi:aspartate 4-decarboxylase